MTSKVAVALEQVLTPSDLENTLQLIKVDDLTDIDKCKVSDQLEAFMIKSDIVTTSKLRRRITRLVASIAASRKPSLTDLFAVIRQASSASEIEDTLNSINLSELEENKAGIEALCQVLQEKLNQPDLVLNRLLRRRISRLVFALKRNTGENCVPASSVAANETPKEQEKNVSKNLDEAESLSEETVSAWCQDIESAASAVELEEVLAKYNPRQIKNIALESKLGSALKCCESKLAVMSNAKIRRRISRMLSCCRNSSDEVLTTPPNVDLKNVSTPYEKTVIGLQHSDTGGSHVPYVVFVGQLNFNVTSLDLVEHFRSGGVEGNIKVRLNTDPKTQKSKGTAFVELDGPRELHKTLGLHHTTLKGRRINVEKTCGGRNKQLRAQKIKLQRDVQKVKASEDVDEIIKQYENSTAIAIRNIGDSTLNRLYACTPREVQDMFELVKLKLMDSSSCLRNYDLLKQLLTEKDGGGQNVDQSRQLGYGSFKRKQNHILPIESAWKKKKTDTV